MGGGTLTERNDGPAEVITDEWFNDLVDALVGDLYPRDANGDESDNTETIGTAAFPFRRRYTQGAFTAGDIKYHNSYDGAAPIGHGWMLCDGRQIIESEYDTEHGAGSWTTYVQSSPLENKYLPNLVNRYSVGADATVQNGSIAITAVGNPGSTADLRHLHQWYKFNNSSTVTDQTYDSSGDATNIVPSSAGSAHLECVFFTSTTAGSSPQSDAFTDLQLATPQSLQPESIAAQVYMRVVE